MNKVEDPPSAIRDRDRIWLGHFGGSPCSWHSILDHCQVLRVPPLQPQAPAVTSGTTTTAHADCQQCASLCHSNCAIVNYRTNVHVLVERLTTTPNTYGNATRTQSNATATTPTTLSTKPQLSGVTTSTTTTTNDPAASGASSPTTTTTQPPVGAASTTTTAPPTTSTTPSPASTPSSTATEVFTPWTTEGVTRSRNPGRCQPQRRVLLYWVAFRRSESKCLAMLLRH